MVAGRAKAADDGRVQPPPYSSAGVWGVAQWVLLGLYVAAPLVLLGVTLWQWRRRRDKPVGRGKIWGGLLATWVGGAAIGVGLGLGYAWLITGHLAGIELTQLGLVAYAAIGLLTLLKSLDLLIQRLIRPVVARVTRGRGRWPTRSLRSLGQFARVVLMVAIGVPFLMAATMVFRVKVTPSETPANVLNTSFTTIRTAAADGTRIAMWWVEAAPASTSSVIVVPGLGSGKADLLPVVAAMLQRGHNVLILDPRGHGESGGQLTSFGDRERLDVLAAERWLRRERPAFAETVNGLGLSMGGAALLAAAGGAAPERAEFDAVAVVDTYDDWSILADDIVERQFAYVPPVNWAAKWIALPAAAAHAGRPLASFRPADAAPFVWPAPLLVVHSEDDELIPFAAGQRLFEAATEPKLFAPIQRLGHNEVIVDGVVMSIIADFFAQARRVPAIARADD